MKQVKKAFTLTELLVVVIVLAVLAAVAMPKFRRTLETRRTTEAENMLSAIRTEQEKRCIAGKAYQADATKLGALAKAGSSAHYNYSLQSTGATAATQGYNLQIPSYKDGRICCSGEGCEELNKNYPSCESITIAEDECAATAVESVASCSGDRVEGTSFSFGSANSSGRCYTDTYYTCDGSGNEVVDHVNDRGCICDVQGYTYNSTTGECENPELECEAGGETIYSGYRCKTGTCNTETGEWEYPRFWSCCATDIQKHCLMGTTWNDLRCQCVEDDTPSTCTKTCGANQTLDEESCTCYCPNVHCLANQTLDEEQCVCVDATEELENYMKYQRTTYYQVDTGEQVSSPGGGVWVAMNEIPRSYVGSMSQSWPCGVDSATGVAAFSTADLTGEQCKSCTVGKQYYAGWSRGNYYAVNIYVCAQH